MELPSARFEAARQDNKIEPTDAELDAFIAELIELRESVPEIPDLEGIPEEELRAGERQAAIYPS